MRLCVVLVFYFFLSINSEIPCSLGRSLKPPKGLLCFTVYSKTLSNVITRSPILLLQTPASLIPVINQNSLRIMRVRSVAVKSWQIQQQLTT